MQHQYTTKQAYNPSYQTQHLVSHVTKGYPPSNTSYVSGGAPAPQRPVVVQDNSKKVIRSNEGSQHQTKKYVQKPAQYDQGSSYTISKQPEKVMQPQETVKRAAAPPAHTHDYSSKNLYNVSHPVSHATSKDNLSKNQNSYKTVNSAAGTYKRGSYNHPYTADGKVVVPSTTYRKSDNTHSIREFQERLKTLPEENDRSYDRTTNTSKLVKQISQSNNNVIVKQINKQSFTNNPPPQQEKPRQRATDYFQDTSYKPYSINTSTNNKNGTTAKVSSGYSTAQDFYKHQQQQQNQAVVDKHERTKSSLIESNTTSSLSNRYQQGTSYKVKSVIKEPTYQKGKSPKQHSYFNGNAITISSSKITADKPIEKTVDYYPETTKHHSRKQVNEKKPSSDHKMEPQQQTQVKKEAYRRVSEQYTGGSSYVPNSYKVNNYFTTQEKPKHHAAPHAHTRHTPTAEPAPVQNKSSIGEYKRVEQPEPLRKVETAPQTKVVTYQGSSYQAPPSTKVSENHDQYNHHHTDSHTEKNGYKRVEYPTKPTETKVYIKKDGNTYQSNTSYKVTKFAEPTHTHQSPQTTHTHHSPQTTHTHHSPQVTHHSNYHQQEPVREVRKEYTQMSMSPIKEESNRKQELPGQQVRIVTPLVVEQQTSQKQTYPVIRYVEERIEDEPVKRVRQERTTVNRKKTFKRQATMRKSMVRESLFKEKKFTSEIDTIIGEYGYGKKNVLGQGAYGTVYKGKHMKTGEEVAIKVINDSMFTSQQERDALQAEIEIMKNLESTNVVKMYDVYFENNLTFMIIELCPDGDLEGYLEKNGGRLPEQRATEIIFQILQGLKDLLKHGYLHRDIKPANALIKGKYFKLADFGLSAKVDSNRKFLNDFVGSPLYMAPQLLDQQPYTIKCDIWSIGLMFYEMLFGKTPWPARDVTSLRNNIRAMPLRFPYDMPIGQYTKSFIEGCLQKKEENRLGWEQLYEHPIFYNQGGEVVKQVEVDIRSREIISEIQESVQLQNQDIHTLFDKYDYYHQGILDKQEFYDLLHKIDNKVTHYEADHIFNLLLQKEHQQQSHIRYSEFKRMFTEFDFTDIDDKAAIILNEVREVIKCNKLDINDVYNQFDYDRKGDLTFTQFYNLFKKLTPGLKDQDIDLVFDAFDDDGNGEVSYQEFHNHLTYGIKHLHDSYNPYKEKARKIQYQIQNHIRYEQYNVPKIFDDFDKDKNGQLDLVEFQQFINQLDSKIPQRDIQALFNYLDSENAGYILKQQFLKKLDH